ncbi:MAG: flagellar biosynthesis protein FlhF [Fibrobacter sp.]|nr:flagellar biosynthesis protein FlhF [Fibrobacter sp.]
MSMKIKKYRASTMREALTLVKDDLGPDAVILKVEEPKNMLGKSEGVEVTAALDEALLTPAATPFAEDELSPVESYTNKGLKNSNSSAQSDFPLKESSSKKESQDFTRAVEEIKSLRHDFLTLRSELKSSVRTATEGIPAEFHNLASGLQETGVSWELTQDILAEIMVRCPVEERTAQKIQELSVEVIASRIPVAPSIPLNSRRAMVTMFVGPTGVGKSTTIAKLVAKEILKGNKSIGIITTDCYRIGALEQMELFARTVEVALETVFGPEDMDKALDNLKDCSIIFVDTAGRSRNNAEHLAELKSITQSVQPDLTYLTLSLNTRDRDMLETVEMFKPLGIDRVLFTKQDETYEQGALFWLPYSTKLPLSHICTGQNIPDDIEDASPTMVAKWVLREVKI